MYNIYIYIYILYQYILAYRRKKTLRAITFQQHSSFTIFISETFQYNVDEQTTFCKHLKMLTLKTKNAMGLLRKLQNLLRRSTLITIYKAFVRPHLDYGDIIYGKAKNIFFHHKSTSKSISNEKFYQELSLDSLQLWCWFRKLPSF